MIDGGNVGFLLEQIASGMSRAHDFTLWLQSGVRSIVIDQVDSMEAFSPGKYIIGGSDADQWKVDLGQVGAAMSQRQRLLLHAGLREAIELLPPEVSADDPGRDSGKNWEHVAIEYLALARRWRAGEILGCLDALIRSKFPRSTAVYAAAILTWRVLSIYDSTTDWREVFLPNGDRLAEPRFRAIYSVPIAMGMCAAQPRKASEYLKLWRPLQDHVKELAADLSAKSVEDMNKLTEAYANLRVSMPQGTSRPSFTAIDVLGFQLTGKRVAGDELRATYRRSKSADRLLPH